MCLASQIRQTIRYDNSQHGATIRAFVTTTSTLVHATEQSSLLRIKACKAPLIFWRTSQARFSATQMSNKQLLHWPRELQLRGNPLWHLIPSSSKSPSEQPLALRASNSLLPKYVLKSADCEICRSSSNAKHASSLYGKLARPTSGTRWGQRGVERNVSKQRAEDVLLSSRIPSPKHVVPR